MDNDEILKFTWYGVSDYQDQNNPERRGWLLPKKDFELVKNNAYLNIQIIVNVDGMIPQNIILGEYVAYKFRLIVKQPYQMCKPTSDNSYAMTIAKEPVFRHGYAPVSFMFNDKVIALAKMNIFTNEH